MKNKLATLVGALALSAAASAQTWIWYPGDYEIWLGNRCLLYTSWMNSCNHVMILGDLLTWYFRDLAGFNPAQPADVYKRQLHR